MAKPVVASVNLRFTLSDAAFEAGLRKALAEDPDLVALQEAGPNRDPIIARIAKELGYGWARPESPNGDPTMPVMWKVSRYQLRACRPYRLARREFVGHLPGRKDRLPASIATELVLEDLLKHEVTVLIDFHLTAEVQYGDDYRKDFAHRLRVWRHKREKRRLGRRARRHQRHARTVYPAGDGNFAGMVLGGFVSCWKDRRGGTLGNRPVDIVFADEEPRDLDTIETPSDHDALIVTY